MMSRLSIAAALLSLLALSGCTPQRAGSASDGADTWQQVKAASTVRIGVKTDTPPFGFVSGETYLGFDVEIGLAIAAELGLKEVVFVPVTSANRIDKLRKGEVDCVIASMTITRSRDEQVDFTLPYFQDGQSLLVLAASPLQSYLDLPGKQVGAVKGSTSAANMRQVAPECTVENYKSFTDMLQALVDGKVDAITSDQIILIGLMKNAKDPAAFRLAGDRFSTEPYGIAVQENQSKWRDALNEGLQRIWENGRWQLTYDTWFGPRAKYRTENAFAITPYPR